MKQTLIILFAALLAHPAFCDETLLPGPPISAADLANHLGVFAQSLTYRPDKPFKFLGYALTYKERQPNGTYVPKANLLTGVYPYDTPQTEVPLFVFLDQSRTALIAGPFASRTKGYDFGALYTTATPPPHRPGGGYILLRTKIDPAITDTEANTKGILELELTATE